MNLSSRQFCSPPGDVGEEGDPVRRWQSKSGATGCYSLQSGVSQIRHSQPFSDHPDGAIRLPQPQETIVPSYSIDLETPHLDEFEDIRAKATSPPPVPSSEPFPTQQILVSDV